MSNLTRREPITIEMRPTRTAQPAQRETWQMQTAPNEYVPQPMPIRANPRDWFDWLTGDGVVQIVAVMLVVAGAMSLAALLLWPVLLVLKFAR